ncbi:MAG: 16S rRNA (cytidine(1402)-2'-O)-methyltransferase [Rhodobacteraceae bacterium]|nr:16S rRNA (cytidine(1402)-2'-O)-methyltransferase [Paracoccaceae bacterium]
MGGISPKTEPGLYLVATPIGTASDITLRALDILREADVLAAEDTRQARKLMDIHGIALNGRPLLPYHDHNGAAMRPRLIEAVRQGKVVAYVSDAGTPLIADPGYQLAAGMIEAGLPITAAPGASAVLAALSLAGLPTDRFLFAGFAPVKALARRRFFEEFSAVPATLVFYEAPRRLADSLAMMVEVFGGERPAAMCRELTKKFEEVRRGSLKELAAYYADTTAPKGEAVLVVGAPLKPVATPEAIDTALREALRHSRVKDAAAEVAAVFDLPRKQLYQRALELGKK